MINRRGLFQKGEANLAKRPEIAEKISLALRGRKHEPLPKKIILFNLNNSGKTLKPKTSPVREKRKKEVFAVWKKTRSLKLAGIELGISRQRVHQILNG